MKSEIRNTEWTTPSIRELAPSDELLAQFAELSGIPVEEIRRRRDRTVELRRKRAA